MLCCGDPDNEFNNILKPEMKEGTDYEIISKETWNMLEQ